MTAMRMAMSATYFGGEAVLPVFVTLCFKFSIEIGGTQILQGLAGEWPE